MHKIRTKDEEQVETWEDRLGRELNLVPGTEPGVSTLEDKTSRKVALVASRIWQVLEATRWKVTPSRKR